MGVSANNPAASRLAAGAAAERRKWITLATLTAVLGGIWLLRGSTGSRPASAAASSKAAEVVASSASSSRPSSPARSLATDPAATAAVLQWLSEPSVMPDRDPFALRADFYRTLSTPVAVEAIQHEPMFWERLEKSLARATDERRRQEILLDNLQREAARLRLQTTVMGAAPTALIDGRLVREGDVIAVGEGPSRADFRVLRIEPRKVIVEREGIRLEIVMQQ